MCQGIINNVITIKILKIFLMYYLMYYIKIILKLINVFFKQ